MSSLLRVAAWFFLAQGAFYLLIGALTPFMMDYTSGGRGRALFFTERSDTGYFGGEPEDLMARDPALEKYRAMLLLAVAGLLAALGLAVMGVAWFAVREGEPWGYWTLLVTGAAALPYWVAIVWKYVAAGAPIGLGDVPPFMWVTTLLWLAGVAIGGVGLRAS